MNIEISIDELREYLEDYFGTAACSGMPAAFMDVSKVQNASAEELIEIAEAENIDLTRFMQ